MKLGEFDVVDIDSGDTVIEQAKALASATTAVALTAGRAKSAWAALAGTYDAPETPQLLAALNTPETVARDLKTVGERAESAMTKFGERLNELRTQRDELIRAIESYLKQAAEVEKNPQMYAYDGGPGDGGLGIMAAGLQMKCNNLATAKAEAEQDLIDQLAVLTQEPDQVRQAATSPFEVRGDASRWIQDHLPSALADRETRMGLDAIVAAMSAGELMQAGAWSGDTESMNEGAELMRQNADKLRDHGADGALWLGMFVPLPGVGVVGGMAARGSARGLAWVSKRFGPEVAAKVAQLVSRPGSKGVSGALERLAAGGGATSGVPKAGTVTGKVGTGSKAGGASEPARVASREQAAAAGRRGDMQHGNMATKEPIDAIHGDMFMIERDVELPGVLPWVMQRSHVSSRSFGRFFGSSWMSFFDQRVVADAGYLMVLEDAGAVRVAPTPEGAEAVCTVYGPRLWLRRVALDHSTDEARSVGDAGGSGVEQWGYAVTEPLRGVTRTYARPVGDVAGAAERVATGEVDADALEAWWLVRVEDRRGNWIEVERDGTGFPVRVRHSGGYLVDVVPFGDRVGALAVGHTALGTDAVAEAVGLARSTGWVDEHTGAGVVLVREYGYDEAGRLVGVRNGSGEPLRYAYDEQDRVTGWYDRVGTSYEYRYGSDGRAVWCGGSAGVSTLSMRYELFDDSSGRTTATDVDGNTTVYEFDASKKPVAVTDPAGRRTSMVWSDRRELLEETDGSGRTTRWEYDGDGRVVAVREAGGRVTLAEYTGSGVEALPEPVRLVLPDDTVWTHEVDAAGDPVRVVDPAGGVTLIERGRSGCPVRVTDPAGVVTEYECDAAGLVTSMTDAAGGRTRVVRDALGQVVRTDEPDGVTTRYDVSVDGWVWSVRASDPAGATTALPLGAGAAADRFAGAVTRFEHDAEGNVTALVDPLGVRTGYVYGPFDRVERVDLPDGSRVSIEYDTEMRLTRIVDGAGRSWVREYDAGGALVAQTDPDGRRVTYAYDGAGRAVARTNASGQVTRWEYDAAGDLVVEDMHNTVHGAQGLETASAAWSDAVMPRVSSTRFRYDAAGRLSEASSAAGKGVSGSGCSVVWERDVLGRVTAEVVDGARTEFAYDAAGRTVGRRTPAGLESSWVFDAAGRPSVWSGSGREVAFGYDAAGRETSRSLPGGVVLRQEWGAGWRLRAQSVHRGPVDRVGLTPVGGGDADVPGSVAEQVMEAIKGTGFDSADGLVRPGMFRSVASRERDAARGEVVAGRLFGYDRAGRLTGIDDVLAGSRRMRLDALGRLTQVVSSMRTGGRTQEDYTYDPTGVLTAVGVSSAGGVGLSSSGTLTGGADTARATSGGFSRSAERVNSSSGAEAGVPGAGGGVLTLPEVAGPRGVAGSRISRAGVMRYEHDVDGRVVRQWRDTLSGQRLEWHFVWDAGDRLVGVRTPVGDVWEYVYDAFDRRVRKTRYSDATVRSSSTTLTDSVPSDRRPVEVHSFAWEGFTLIEHTRQDPDASESPGVAGQTVTWDQDPNRGELIAQRITGFRDEWGSHDGSAVEPGQAGELTQADVDARFAAIVTDLVGAPAEAFDDTGAFVWTSTNAPRTAYGLPAASVGDSPRLGLSRFGFPGQLIDPETGWWYNVHRYYDPASGAYTSPDPIGLGGGLNNTTYPRSPHTTTDPLGLQSCAGTQGALQDVNAERRGAKRGPKPFGTGPHNLKIAEIADKVQDGVVIGGGQSGLPEAVIPIVNGFKTARRPDILVRRADGSLYGINVGKVSRRTGLPVKRELEALQDLESAGIEMHFVPYN